jgi:hypothetical protein
VKQASIALRSLLKQLWDGSMGQGPVNTDFYALLGDLIDHLLVYRLGDKLGAVEAAALRLRCQVALEELENL